VESFDALHLIPTIRSTHPACVDSERDSTVTEYELIDALGTYSSGMQSWTAMYFSGVSAFLITAYVVGKRLTTMQTTVISAAFTLLAFNSVGGYYGLGIRLVECTDELRELRPGNIYVASEIGVSIYTLLFLIGIVASPKFMWDIRHPKT
jgi:hypothetical protein